ncbi:hypothetical protein [Paracraurococcus ruber]|uniref:hypothetical protein n=1 Tax=Paracraurococcus ruber TaxID=77675 RepID=UPI001057D49F|nr:hypothetical protein [Paracraurococcus ruber]TDG30565.1 hypothetical protein E2C05_13960 [Paracraurococcus ruber]
MGGTQILIEERSAARHGRADRDARRVRSDIARLAGRLTQFRRMPTRHQQRTADDLAMVAIGVPLPHGGGSGRAYALA